MTFITKKHLSRRTFLRGTGVTLALPLLESMVPAATALAQTAASAEDAAWGASTSRTARRWTSGRRPARARASSSPRSCSRSSRSAIASASSATWRTRRSRRGTGEDTGGAENHVRAAAVFLSGAHPVKKNEAHVGVTVDQVAAQHIGQDTPLPSIELSIEPLNLNCGEPASAAPTATRCRGSRPRCRCRWRTTRRSCSSGCSATAAPTRSGRSGGSSRGACSTRSREQVPSLEKDLPAGDRRRLREYLDDVREIERRVKQVDATLSRNLDLPDAPVGIPADFEEHIKLMFDLQVLAYKAEITRISTLMLARENSNAVYSGERRARRVPQRVAPLERAQEHGPVRGDQPLPREDARLLPREAAGDARRRRHAARSLDDPLRQQPERRQRAQLRSAAGRPGRRRVGTAARAAATCVTRRTRRCRTCCWPCSTSWARGWIASATARDGWRSEASGLRAQASGQGKSRGSRPKVVGAPGTIDPCTGDGRRSNRNLTSLQHRASHPQACRVNHSSVVYGHAAAGRHSCLVFLDERRRTGDFLVRWGECRVHRCELRRMNALLAVEAQRPCDAARSARAPRCP